MSPSPLGFHFLKLNDKDFPRRLPKFAIREPCNWLLGATRKGFGDLIMGSGLGLSGPEPKGSHS